MHSTFLPTCSSLNHGYCSAQDLAQHSISRNQQSMHRSIRRWFDLDAQTSCVSGVSSLMSLPDSPRGINVARAVRCLLSRFYTTVHCVELHGTDRRGAPRLVDIHLGEQCIAICAFTLAIVTSSPVGSGLRAGLRVHIC